MIGHILEVDAQTQAPLPSLLYQSWQWVTFCDSQPTWPITQLTRDPRDPWSGENRIPDDDSTQWRHTCRLLGLCANKISLLGKWNWTKYGDTDGHDADDVTWPWNIEVVNPICLVPNANYQENGQRYRLGDNEAPIENSYTWESNCQVTDGVTWLRKVKAVIPMCYGPVSGNRLEIDLVAMEHL